MKKPSAYQSPYKVFSLVLRRMRAPLIVLIFIYAIAVLGLVLIPGQDDQGQPWRMDFFHAFYFVSYMATTIGFGEIPYQFTEAQRMWTVVSLYMTVIAWLYAIGNILTLIQDPALKRAITENRFRRNIHSLREPFYLICGYGETGSLVTTGLTQRGLRVVALDINPDRINELLLIDLDVYVPGLTADAGEPEILRTAGLESPHCAGVMALTNDDHVNLKVAITSKLLNPSIPVICRAEEKSVQANMASFGSDFIINPFDAFANQLAIALHSPDMHKIFEWLTQLPKTPLSDHTAPPHGRWIICGYGRFGKAVEKYLQYEGLQTTIVEAKPLEAGCEGDFIEGRGTEAVTLRAANIKEATGIVAGTDDDADNLSIIMTARDLNPDIFTVARQNKRSNDVIFEAASINLVMQHSRILTLKILALATAPLLNDFLRLARHNNNEWATELTERLRIISKEITPDLWTVEINEETAPAILDARRRGRDIRLGHITSDPRNRERQMNCLALLIKRNGELLILPEVSTKIENHDQILFCGRYGIADVMSLTLGNLNALRYIETGETRPDGIIWQWLAKEKQS